MAVVRFEQLCVALLALGVLVTALLGIASAQVQQPPSQGPPPEVVDVRIEGADRIPHEYILPQIQTRAGRPLDSRLVEQDVIRLNATRWFVDVKFFYHHAPGGVVVIFQVVERPRLEYVRYVGNEKMKEKQIAKKTELRVGAALDPYAVEEGRRRILELYHERGYPKVDVTIFEGNKMGDHGAVYIIHEGPRQRIKEVKFVGTSITSDGRLRTQIESKKPILWVFKGYVDRDKIDQDVDRLTAYYRSLGFFRARVGRELEFDEKEKRLTLTFVVDEGPRYAIRNISFIGNRKLDEEELQTQLELKPGQYFNQTTMNSDVAALRDLYGGCGYAFVDVQADPRFDEEPGQLDLVYNIDEGARFHVGRINVHIEGDNPHTRETVVLNRFSIRPSDIFDTREIADTERRLKASGIFMNSPATGEVPRIEFRPPDPELQATGPQAASGVRGQSPDPPQQAAQNGRGSAAGPNSFAPRFVPPSQMQPATQPAPDGPAPTRPRRDPPGYIPPRQPIVRGQSPFGGQRILSPSTRPLPTWPQGQAAAQPMPATPAVPQPQYPQPQYPQPQYPQTQYPQTPSYGAAPSGAAGPIYQGAPSYAVPSGSAPPQALPPTPAPANYASQPSPIYTSPYSGAPTPQGGLLPRQTVPPPAYPTSAAQPVPEELEDPGVLYPERGYPFLDPDEPTQPLDLDVYVNEAQTGRLMVGVGVNSDAGLVGNIVLDEQNFDWTRYPRSWADIRNATAFRGAGTRLRLEAIPGNQVQRYMATYTDPYVFDTQNSLGLSGFFYDRRYLEWDEQRLGGRIAVGRQLTPDLSATVSLRGESVNIRNPIVPTPEALAEVVGNNEIWVARFQLAHDTRDSPFLATEGHLIELSYEQGFGQFDFPRGGLDARQFFLIRQRPDGSGRHVLSLLGRLGITGNNTPIFERYYAGGFSTLRGFDFRGVSPRVDGVAVGGDFLMLGSVEYLFPLTPDDALRGVVFVDYGTVEESVKIVEDSFRVSPGFGLRISIAAMGPAPIALDLAVPVAHAEGDDINNFAFFVGLQR